MYKKTIGVWMAAVLAGMALTGCGSSDSTSTTAAADAAVESTETTAAITAKAGDSATGKTDLADSDFDTSYQPQKDTYNIYCTYKNIHSWYDAIKTGIDAAVGDLAEEGITVNYEWYGPAQPDAVDQVNSIETAVGQGYDMIAIDVNQPETTAKAINAAVENGVLVSTFGTSDIEDCERSFFVGNVDPYGDGYELAKAVCEKMNGEGQIGLLAGTMGASAHESRLQGFYDAIAEYPNIEVVDEQRDDDSVEKAISITESWLQAYPNLGGILCNNMSNPVGACQAVADAGKSGEIIIGGMDHDLRTLQYLKDGTLYVARVQNCYDMGYKLVYNAIKAIDGEAVEDSTNVGSTSVYAADADRYIEMLYGNN